MYKLNLQMFAEEDEELVDSGGYSGKEEEDDEEELAIEEEETDDEEEVDIEEDEEDDVEKPKKVLTKAEKAIIKYKQEAKDLRQQLQAREQADIDKELEIAEVKRVTELTKKGLSPEEAEVKAKDESEMKKLRLKLTQMELDKLSEKYAGIGSYAKQLSEDKEKFPDFSYEQLYLANYSKESEFDKKTRLEQELLHTKQKAKDKTLEDGTTKQKSTIKMNKSDIRAYNYAKEHRPNLTKKQFMDNLYGDLE